MWIEILLVISITILLWQSLKSSSNYPPGPWGLPFIGYIPLGSKGYDYILKNLHEKYGDVVSFKIGTKRMVLLYDFKMIKEAFGGPNMVDRPDIRILRLAKENENDQTLGVLASSGTHWHHLRRFTLRHLRDLGMGKSRMVCAVQNEAIELVNDIKRLAGKPTSLPKSINVSILNVIWQMVASKRFNLNEKDGLYFESLMTNFQKHWLPLLISDFYPWIENMLPRYIANKITKDDLYQNFSSTFVKYFQESVDDHAKNLDENDVRDFIDAYLIEMKNQKDNPESNLSIEDLLANIADLFRAGSETTATTLEWSMLYLASYPHIQIRLQKEIDEILPKGTLATLEDKQRLPYTDAYTDAFIYGVKIRVTLPYTDAFIHEVLRFSSMVNTGVFHMSTVETKLGGYVIPKGSIVMGVSAIVHYNNEHFEKPNEFRPERFLNSEGKFVNPKEGFLPFSIGKRQCVGEALARMELLIFITTLVQNLNIAIPEGNSLDLKPMEIPIVRFPKENQKLLFTVR